MTILIGDFNAKVGRKDIFKPTSWGESLHEISNVNGFTVLTFMISKMSKIQCSHIVTFMDLLGHLLM
jgi:hypothetical protein